MFALPLMVFITWIVGINNSELGNILELLHPCVL